LTNYLTDKGSQFNQQKQVKLLKEP